MARAAIPGADNPKAYTLHDFLKGKLAFNKRTMTDAYNAVGKRDAKWDAAAVKFLDAMALWFAYGTVQDVLYRTVDVPKADAVAALGKVAVDAGCDDPLVVYCYGNILTSTSRRAEGQALIYRGADALAKSKYPAFRICAAARRAARDRQGEGLPKGRQAAVPYWTIVWEQMIACGTAKHDPADVRYLLEVLGQQFEEYGTGGKLAYCEKLAASKTTDPWLLHLFHGRYHIKAAWDARGAGWADNVTKEGWDGFAKHLAKAREHLIKAHELRPEYPEAATEMIAVAMGAGEALNETTRAWFEKAVAAQFDHVHAYGSYAYSLLPRWGGSYEQMFALAAECVATNRFDTLVPMYAMELIARVDRDSTHDMAVYNAPQVRPLVRTLFERAVKQAPTAETRKWYASYQIALLWRTAQYKEAAQLIEKIDAADLDQRPFDPYGVVAKMAVGHVFALTSPHATKIEDAERDAREGDLNSAMVALSAVSSKLDAGHPAQAYLKSRVRTWEVAQEFASGKWVALRPEKELGLIPWARTEGVWTVDDDGELVGAVAEGGPRAMLALPVPVGFYFDLKATVEPVEPGQVVAAALVPQYRAAETVAQVRAEVGEGGKGVTGVTNGRARTLPMAVKAGQTLAMYVRGDVFQLAVDGKIVLQEYLDVPVKRADDGVRPTIPAIGLVVREGGDPAAAGVRFRDVMIRRVEAPKEEK